MSKQSNFQEALKFWKGISNDDRKDANITSSISAGVKRGHTAMPPSVNVDKLDKEQCSEKNSINASDKTHDTAILVPLCSDKVEKPHLVVKINQALENGDFSEFKLLLTSPCLKLIGNVHQFAASLYFTELDYIRRLSEMDLELECIVKATKFLSTIARINEAAQVKNYEQIFYLAKSEGINLQDLDENMKNKYGVAMHTALVAKQKLISSRSKSVERVVVCRWLNHAYIQDCIDMVNTEEFNYEKTIPRIVTDVVDNTGCNNQKKKKESHSRRTQRILKSKLNELNEKLADTERCLEEYASAFSAKENLNARINELQEENYTLKMELDLVKAKLEEIEALAGKGATKNAKLLSKFDSIENENAELKTQLDEANNKLIMQKGERNFDFNVAVDDVQKLQSEVRQLNQMKKDKLVMLAKIKNIQVKFLKMVKSGSWINGYHNIVEITATLREVTEMVKAFDQFT